MSRIRLSLRRNQLSPEQNPHPGKNDDWLRPCLAKLQYIAMIWPAPFPIFTTSAGLPTPPPASEHARQEQDGDSNRPTVSIPDWFLLDRFAQVVCRHRIFGLEFDRCLVISNR